MNLVRMEARRRSRAAKAHRNRALADPPTEDFDIAVAWRFDAQADVAVLQSGIADLSPRDREVLFLAALGGGDEPGGRRSAGDSFGHCEIVTVSIPEETARGAPAKKG